MTTLEQKYLRKILTIDNMKSAYIIVGITDNNLAEAQCLHETDVEYSTSDGYQDGESYEYKDMAVCSECRAKYDTRTNEFDDSDSEFLTLDQVNYILEEA
jgi:hypothetical protein